ncbi:hypothetical protein DFH07DRAFT_973845 [Mycena maculata]|uniref:DUF6534 domain-containing protein n=1 Tax=Mycena maculata TaxID=230809 RepID=A0AAD7HBQ5_9AGAR|nr:hypothetical protein DFH07DRAFT_973845 [Mycena maculata]
MVINLESTYEPWLLCLFLAAVLVGAELVPNVLPHNFTDRLATKITVFSAVFFATVQLGLCYASVHYRLIQKIGDPPTELIWSDSSLLMGTFFCAVTEQLFFSGRLHHLVASLTDPKPYLWGVYMTYFLSGLQLLSGIAEVVISYHTHSFRTPSAKVATLVQLFSSMGCNVLICIGLCWYLRHQQHGFILRPQLGSINALVKHAINRGVSTALVSTLSAFLFFVFPTSLYFLVTLAPGGHLYTLTLLSSLNMCFHIRNLNVIERGTNRGDRSAAEASSGPAGPQESGAPIKEVATGRSGERVA